MWRSIKIPRRNENARDREEKKWSEDFIKQLTRKLGQEKRAGHFTREYDIPEPVRTTKKGK